MSGRPLSRDVAATGCTVGMLAGPGLTELRQAIDPTGRVFELLVDDDGAGRRSNAPVGMLRCAKLPVPRRSPAACQVSVESLSGFVG